MGQIFVTFVSKKFKHFILNLVIFRQKSSYFCIPKMSDTHVMLMFIPSTAKRILERLGIQTASSFFKMSVFLIWSQFLIFLAFIWLGFLSRKYWSSLDHDLIASIWEKATSILAGNLNSGRCTTVLTTSWFDSSCNFMMLHFYLKFYI